MASNLKRSKRTVGKRVNDLSRRVSRLQKNPSPRRIGPHTIASGNLDPAVIIDINAGADVAVDFYANNNQNASIPTTPTINNDDTAITHIINTDSTATITFNWNYTTSDIQDDSSNIDGFVIHVYQSTSSSAYSFTSANTETTYFAARDKRSFVLVGVPADKYFTFGVKAYRVVDSNIDAAGVKYSAIVKSTFAGEDPFRPTSSISYTGTISGTAASTVATAAVNFNANNDRNSSTPTSPVVLTDGTAIDHTLNTDASADISFEWTYTTSTTQGAANNIDGFIVYVYSSTSSSSYTFGTTPASETIYYTSADKRALILSGVAADLYYTFGVRAYRTVDSDINANGILYSTGIIQSSRGEENPYRPSATVPFAGNITGTINGTAASTVATAATNFNANNDRNSSTPTSPTINSDGTAIDHVLNTDASTDISFEWSYTTSTTQGAANNIDGFMIYVYSSTNSAAYTFGTTPASETIYYAAPDRRAFILSGVAPDLYYTFGVRAYRVVDSDVDATGVLYSTGVIQSSRAEENPYRPSATVAFTGNIGGTLLSSTPASNVYNATTNFNANNDQITDTPNTPTSVTLTTGAQNTNATIDLATTWAFDSTGNAGNVDGFTVYLRTVRPSLIDSLSASGSVVTYTTKTAHGFVAGDTVVVSGITPAGYSGTFTVLASPAPTTTTFAVTNSTTGTATYTTAQVYNSTKSSADITTADLNTTIQQVNLTAEKRSHTFSGVSPNNAYKVAVRAYRVVDTNVNAAGVLFGSLANSTSVTPTTPSLGGDSAIYIGTGKMFIGTGNYGNTNTGFYVDSGGYFSLKDRLTFNPVTPLLTVKGRIEASEGAIGGVTISSTKLYTGSGNYNSSDTGFYLDSSGNFSLKNSLSWNGTTLSVAGTITASAGSIGSYSISSGSLTASGSGSSGLFVGWSSNIALNTESKIVTNTYYSDNFNDLGFHNVINFNDVSAPEGGIRVERGTYNAAFTLFFGYAGYRYSALGPQNISDKRLKDILDKQVHGLDTVNSLKVETFTFKRDVIKTEKVGFVAQDLYEVLPNSVSVGGEDPQTRPWTITMESIVPYLAKAIQELSSKVDALEARLS